MKIYVIYDQRENKFWKRGSKVAWVRPGAAKSAVTSQLSWKKRTTFSEQDRYKCFEIDLAQGNFSTRPV